jgi:NADH-quinone oxidoreductase subunit N
MVSSLPDLMPALPEIFLACAGMTLLLIGVFLGEKSTRIVASLAVMSFIIAGALLVMGSLSAACSWPTASPCS